MLPIVTTLLGFLPQLFTGVKEYVGKKQELQKLERTAEVEMKKAVLTAQINQATQLAISETELDRMSIEKTGYGDEYLLIITTLPLVLSLFVSPAMDWYMMPSEEYVQGMIAEAMKNGFINLRELPEYYWYGMGAVYLHFLGMRRMFTALIERFGGSFGSFNKGK